MTEAWSYDRDRQLVHDENGLKVATGVTAPDAIEIVALPRLIDIVRDVARKGEADASLVHRARGLLDDMISGAIVDAPAERPQPDPPLWAILDDMLAYEAEQFDPPPVFDVIGERKLPGGLLSETLIWSGIEDREEAEALAVGSHNGGFYDKCFVREVETDLDVSGADLVDAFTVWREQLKAALAAQRPAGGAPRTIVLTIEGGALTGVTSPDPTPDLRFLVIDHDTDTAHESEVTTEVLNDDGDWEEVVISELMARTAPLPELRELERDDT